MRHRERRDHKRHVGVSVTGIRDFGSLVAVAEDLAGWVPAIERRIDFTRRIAWAR